MSGPIATLGTPVVLLSIHGRLDLTLTGLRRRELQLVSSVRLGWTAVTSSRSALISSETSSWRTVEWSTAFVFLVWTFIRPMAEFSTFITLVVGLVSGSIRLDLLQCV